MNRDKDRKRSFKYETVSTAVRIVGDPAEIRKRYIRRASLGPRLSIRCVQ